MSERCDERRCADLIRQAEGLPVSGGIVIASPDRYTATEVRVAHESVRRMRGERFNVLRVRLASLPALNADAAVEILTLKRSSS